MNQRNRERGVEQATRSEHEMSVVLAVTMLFGALLSPAISLAGDCQPTTPEEVKSKLGMTEALAKTQPDRALEQVNGLEKNLPCLEGVIDSDALASIYRVRGVALGHRKDFDAAFEAFEQAARIEPDTECSSALSKFGTRGPMKQLQQVCEDASANTRERQIVVKLEGVKGIETIYINGRECKPQEDYVPADLSPGRHLLQFTHTDGNFSSKWLEVPAPEDPDTVFIWMNLKRLGLAPFVEEKEAVGTLQIEGLPEGAVVQLDGRVRRDLPVLRNVSVGERHLIIRTRDGSVRGVTVMIKENEETVYSLQSSSYAGQGRRGGGLSARKLASFGSLGVGVLSAAGSGLMMVMASNQYSEAEDLYAGYQGAVAGADFDTLYGDAEGARVDAHRTQITGLTLGGLAVLAVGAGSFLALTDDGDAVGALEPYFAPLAGTSERLAGVTLGLKGRF